MICFNCDGRYSTQWHNSDELWERIKSDLEISKDTFNQAKRELKDEGLMVKQQPVLGPGWFNCLPRPDGTGCDDPTPKPLWQGRS